MILRLIIFPFVVVIGLVAFLRYWVLWCFDFVKYGGEMIGYNKRTNRKTIKDVFDKLNKNDI